MEYVDRSYRRRFRGDRWKYFVVRYKESDLCIGVDRLSWQEGIPVYAEQFVRRLRGEMDAWIAGHPEYERSLVPCEADDAPMIFQQMSAVARVSGIGPMSAVAGAVAQKVGEALLREFGVREVVVENGGDIYASI